MHEFSAQNCAENLFLTFINKKEKKKQVSLSLFSSFSSLYPIEEEEERERGGGGRRKRTTTNNIILFLFLFFFLLLLSLFFFFFFVFHRRRRRIEREEEEEEGKKTPTPSTNSWYNRSSNHGGTEWRVDSTGTDWRVDSTAAILASELTRDFYRYSLLVYLILTLILYVVCLLRVNFKGFLLKIK